MLATYNQILLREPAEKATAIPWLVESEAFGPLPPCTEGGFRMHTGFDVNENGVLDASERQDTVTLCHGLRGLSGPQGATGGSGANATVQRLETTPLPLGNLSCPAGGVSVRTGLDLDGNGHLEEAEINTNTTLCNGLVGLDGQQGVDGLSGWSALVDKVPAPAYLCADGFVLRFGVDDGVNGGQEGNGLLEAEEVRETLNFCFSPLRSERITDLFIGTGNSMTSGCDAAAWMGGANAFLFAANDGTNGCELYRHDPASNTTEMVSDLSPTGDASPGRDLGMHAVGDGQRVVFDATDGVSGRQLWTSDGTANGTTPLGSVEASSPSVWAEGLVFRSPDGQRLWTNGTVLTDWLNVPVWDLATRQAVGENLSGLTAIGDAWFYATSTAVWFSAADQSGDVEPHRLGLDGQVTSWSINEFGSAQLTEMVAWDSELLAAASRGGVKQVLHLQDNGSHAWLTSISPSSGDTALGDGMGLHIIGDNLVYDAAVVSGQSRLWTTNLASGITLQLSAEILAPGAQVGVANTGTMLLFDCMTSTVGTETCITDGTPQGSRVLEDLTPGLMSTDIRGMAAIGEGWVVVADGVVNGTNAGVLLWLTTAQGMRPVYDPWGGIGNSSEAMTYGRLIVSDTQVWVICHDGQHGHEWHRWSHGELSDDWIVLHR